jgi:hypothetical protein
MVRSNSWSDADLKILAKLYPTRPVEEVSRLFKRTVPAVKSTAKRYGISKGRRFWSAAERKLVRKLYPNRPTKEIAEALGRTVRSVYQAADKLGLKKTEDFLRSEEAHCRLQKGSRIGEAFQFKKGQVPANKGLRRPGWHAGRMRETQFKKGQRSGVAAKRWRPIGTILADPEGFLRIKVRERTSYAEEPGWHPNVWPLLSHQVWEKHKGPIPPKHMVIFKDGDRNNCEIENLDCISMAENARRNRMWNILPRELAEAIHLNGQLKRRIRNLDGKKHGQGS